MCCHLTSCLFKRTQFLSRGQDLRYKIIWRFRWGHETVFYLEYEILNIRLKKKTVKWPQLDPGALKWLGRLRSLTDGSKTPYLPSRCKLRYTQLRQTAARTWLLTTRLEAKAAFALSPFFHHPYGRKDKINPRQSAKCQPFIYLPHQRLSDGKKDSSRLIMKPIKCWSVWKACQ